MQCLSHGIVLYLESFLCFTASCPLAPRDTCACRLLHDQLVPMTSLSLLGIQATAPPQPPLGVAPVQTPAPSGPSALTNNLSCVEKCPLCVHLCRRAADGLQNSTIDPRKLLLRLDALLPSNSDELDKVRARLLNHQKPSFSSL